MKLQRLLWIIVLLCPLVGCTAQGAGRFAQALAIGLAAGAAAPISPPKLMIFGGTSHKDYLGCLNCTESATDSIFNRYGEYGSPYQSNSIWNHYGDYGSRYSDYSVCNKYSQDPPVIVDQEGAYYGRLTLNEYHSELGIGRNYFDFLMAVCH